MKKVGHWHLPDWDEHFEPYILRDGGYQIKEREYALSFVKKFDFAIDVGAHVGFWSKELSEKFKLLIAFEPIKEHIECFEANLSLKNVILFPCGLSSEKKNTFFESAGNNSGHTFISDEGNVSAYVTKLDDILNEEGLDFIKIDVEGHELEVLRGAKETLLKSKPIINIEQKFNPYAGYYLEKLGAELLGQFKSEYIYGWK